MSNSFDVIAATVKAGGRGKLVNKGGHMVDACSGAVLSQLGNISLFQEKEIALKAPLWSRLAMAWVWLNTAARQGSPWCGDNRHVSTVAPVGSLTLLPTHKTVSEAV